MQIWLYDNQEVYSYEFNDIKIKKNINTKRNVDILHVQVRTVVLPLEPAVKHLIVLDLYSHRIRNVATFSIL